MAKRKATNISTIVKRAAVLSGFACGLLTAWLTLGLLSSSNSPIFVHTTATSADVTQSPRVKLTLYYSPRQGPAPNPPGESSPAAVFPTTAAPEDTRRRLALFVDELKTLLGPGVTVEPAAANSSGGAVRCGSLPVNSREIADSATSHNHIPSDDVTRVNGTSSSRWPPAQHVPLTIEPNFTGTTAAQNANISPALDFSSSWFIVFPKGTPAVQAVSRVSAAVTALQRKRTLIVANNLRAMAEIGHGLRELQTRFPGEMETLIVQWQQNLSELCDLAAAIQNVRVRQEPPVDPLLGELQATRANLLKRRQQLLMTHTAEHPETKQIESLLAEVEQEIQLRSRRQRDYSVSSEPEETGPSSSGHGAGWLPLRHGNAIGTPAPSSVIAPNVNSSTLTGQRSDNADYLQRFESLRSAIQTCDANMRGNLDEVRAGFEKLQQQFDAAQHELQKAMAEWELASQCMPEFDGPYMAFEITKRPTLWAFLLSLVTGTFVYGAVVALMTGLTESQRIRSVEQLSAMTDGPVFHISLSSKEQRFVDEVNSISPPHYPTVTAEMDLSTNQRV